MVPMQALQVLTKKSDRVEYHSSTHKDWLQAIVIEVDGDGRIVIDLKPNTWMSKESQAQQIRPRRRCASDPAIGSQPCRSPVREHSPSVAARRRPASPGSHAATPAGGSRSGTPSRAPTPSRAHPPARRNSTPQARQLGAPPGIPRARASPIRPCRVANVAGMAIAGM